MRILIVDSDQQLRRFLEDFLNEKGFKGVYTAPPEGMLKRARETIPELAFVEVPGEKELDRIQQLRHLLPGLRIIAVSSKPDEVIGKRALEIGVDDFLFKPFDLAHLEDLILQFMEASQGSAAL